MRVTTFKDTEDERDMYVLQSIIIHVHDSLFIALCTAEDLNEFANLLPYFTQL